MDNLTHTLVGAVLGYAGLRRRTRLAMPALMIGANLPDIDATCVVFGMEQLAMRRGLTHGPPALILLPLLLTVGLMAFDRRQARPGIGRAEGPPARPAWLFLLAVLGCLTHVGLDWLNSYGVRLLTPFSRRWFHGDALFIVDWVLWLGLGLGVALAWRRERRGANGRRPARIAILGATAYILANVGLSAAVARDALRNEPFPRVAVANPVPFAFWERDLLLGQANDWRRRRWSLFAGVGALAPLRRRRACALPDMSQRASLDPDAQAFLFWSRMPFAEATSDGRLRLRDARFAGGPTGDRFTVETGLPCKALRQPRGRR